MADCLVLAFSTECAAGAQQEARELPRAGPVPVVFVWDHRCPPTGANHHEYSMRATLGLQPSAQEGLMFVRIGLRTSAPSQPTPEGYRGYLYDTEKKQRPQIPQSLAHGDMDSVSAPTTCL